LSIPVVPVSLIVIFCCARVFGLSIFVIALSLAYSLDRLLKSTLSGECSVCYVLFFFNAHCT
jgi:hypothetical protein